MEIISLKHNARKTLTKQKLYTMERTLGYQRPVGTLSRMLFFTDLLINTIIQKTST